MDLSNNYKKDKKRKATIREVVEEEEQKNSCKAKMQKYYQALKTVKINLIKFMNFQVF